MRGAVRNQAVAGIAVGDRTDSIRALGPERAGRQPPGLSVMLSKSGEGTSRRTRRATMNEEM